MEHENAESKEHSGSERRSEPASDNFQTIKVSLPKLGIIKGLYDACGLEMYGPPENSGIPELPQWENDWLESIIALPLNMFYNTGVALRLRFHPTLASNKPFTIDQLQFIGVG